MSAAEEILQAGISDVKAALAALRGFNAQWQIFAAACDAKQPELAAAHGERLIALAESAVDLYLSSHRRMAQFERLTKDVDE